MGHEFCVARVAAAHLHFFKLNGGQFRDVNHGPVANHLIQTGMGQPPLVTQDKNALPVYQSSFAAVLDK